MAAAAMELAAAEAVRQVVHAAAAVEPAVTVEPAAAVELAAAEEVRQRR